LLFAGGGASVLHGSDRNTFDLDIYVDLTDKNLNKLIQVAKEQRWIPRVPEPIEHLLNIPFAESKKNDRAET